MKDVHRRWHPRIWILVGVAAAIGTGVALAVRVPTVAPVPIGGTP